MKTYADGWCIRIKHDGLSHILLLVAFSIGLVIGLPIQHWRQPIGSADIDFIIIAEPQKIVNIWVRQIVCLTATLQTVPVTAIAKQIGV